MKTYFVLVKKYPALKKISSFANIFETKEEAEELATLRKPIESGESVLLELVDLKDYLILKEDLYEAKLKLAEINRIL